MSSLSRRTVLAACVLFALPQNVLAAEPPPQPPSAVASLGLTLDGLTITQVEKDSKAERAGLQPGDVIAVIGEADIKTPRAAEAAVGKAVSENWVGIPLRARRGGELLAFYLY
ncbi:MAG: PDZ domain-containing protein [Rhodospirillaceae bacterium]